MKPLMSFKTLLTTGSFIGLLIAVCGGVFFLQQKVNHYAPPREVPYHPSLFSGPLNRLMTLEYKEAVADIIWLQAVQFMGERDEKLLKKQNRRTLYDFINRATDIDTRFGDAYTLGAIGLSVLGDEVDLSNAILQKGIVNNVKDWNIPFLLAFNYSYHLNNYSKAAYYADLASRFPESPAYLPFLAARFYTQGGDTQTALFFLKGVYLAAKDEGMREKIAERITEIEKEISSR